MKNFDNKNYLVKLRHSAAHLLAAAVRELWPKAKRAIGPAIEDGFYYDFDFGDIKISENDFPKIEEKMRELVKKWTEFTRVEILWKDAQQKFSNNPYKLELIDEFHNEDKKLTIYKSGDYEDLCRGGHIENPAEELRYFKLLSVAGAYWRGSEKNKMLTRIYGTAWPTKEELDKYLWQLEEAKKRDHRKIGKELELFTLTDEVGAGLVMWTPKGAIVRRELEKFIIEEQTKRGYQHVYTPHIGKKQLWQTSGHWDLYRDKMYAPMAIDKDEYLVKPMNCPFHMMIYKSKPRSYRDLPLRLAEIASVYRYEKPGELSGMLRVRYITQDDSHIFCTEEQVINEFIGVFEYMAFLLSTFGLTDYYLRLGLRSPKEKYLGDDQTWKKAETEIVKAIEKKGLDFVRSEGDAAFYGPKLDVIVKDSLGREWQCGTIQVDFMLPSRFKLEYVDKDGLLKRPALIHRAPLGSLERWMAILIEHFGGAFPTWLAPAQAEVIPVSEKSLAYACKVSDTLQKNGIRSHVDESGETVAKKIRGAEKQKVPYMLVVGPKEEQTNSVSVRGRGEINLGPMPVSKFMDSINREISSKSLKSLVGFVKV